MLNIALLEENLKTKTYPCGETFMYISVPLEEALPSTFDMCRRP